MTRWGHIFNVIYDVKRTEHLNCLIPSAWILIYNAYYETTSRARAFKTTLLSFVHYKRTFLVVTSPEFEISIDVFKLIRVLSGVAVLITI